jgi:hypothetical protein
VTLSSIEPTDLWLAPTAARLDFDLLALRARRKQQAIQSPAIRQEGGQTKKAQIASRPFGERQLDEITVIVNREEPEATYSTILLERV